MSEERAAGHARRTWLFCGVGLLCALLVKPLQDRFDARRGEPEPGPDLLYFSSPAAVKRIAMGYDNLLADFYWMRAIQYYGRRDEADKRPVRYKNLSTLLDITTTLDPHLLDAYRAGSNFLAEPDPIGAGQPGEALKLLTKGIRVHPQDWRLYYDSGFIYYWFFQDYRTAGEIWLSASRLPSAPYWMQGLAAMSMSKGGAFEIAFSLWKRQYEESDRKNVRENAKNHLYSFQAARDLLVLERKVEKYKARTGSYPQSLQDLAQRQTRKFETIDPSGVPYQYDPQTGSVNLSPETKFRYLQVPQTYLRQFTIDD